MAETAPIGKAIVSRASFGAVGGRISTGTGTARAILASNKEAAGVVAFNATETAGLPSGAEAAIHRVIVDICAGASGAPPFGMRSIGSVDVMRISRSDFVGDETSTVLRTAANESRARPP